MIDKLIKAIENREYISFSYSGLQRVAQPAAIGVSAKGNELLRCYQTEGGHVTPGHEWDLCTVAKIQNLQLTGNQFQGDPPHYKRGDKAMARVFAEL